MKTKNRQFAVEHGVIDRVWWPKQSSCSTKSCALSNGKIVSRSGQSDLPDGQKSDLPDGQTLDRPWLRPGFYPPRNVYYSQSLVSHPSVVFPHVSAHGLNQPKGIMTVRLILILITLIPLMTLIAIAKFIFVFSYRCVAK